MFWAVLDCGGLYLGAVDCTWLWWAVLGCTGMNWTVLGGVNSYLSVYSAIFGMVTNNRTNNQPGDPRASLLLTSVKRQSFAKGLRLVVMTLKLSIDMGLLMIMTLIKLLMMT